MRSAGVLDNQQADILRSLTGTTVALHLTSIGTRVSPCSAVYLLCEILDRDCPLGSPSYSPHSDTHHNSIYEKGSPAVATSATNCRRKDQNGRCENWSTASCQELAQCIR